jgi:hypothetical protein
MMHAVSARFRYYECVPLGWVPVPAGDTYHRGYSAELDETDWWLPPTWSGVIRASELRRPDVKATYDVLNELVRAGVVQLQTSADRFRYHLTWQGLRYYFDGDDFGNNPSHNSFVCFSGMEPQRVIWSEPVHVEQNRDGSGETQVFRAAFEWRPGPPAAWANDAFLQSHSVILEPVNGPLVVRFVNRRGEWEIDYPRATALPRLGFADASVWPASRP